MKPSALALLKQNQNGGLASVYAVELQKWASNLGSELHGAPHATKDLFEKLTTSIPEAFHSITSIGKAPNGTDELLETSVRLKQAIMEKVVEEHIPRWDRQPREQIVLEVAAMTMISGILDMALACALKKLPRRFHGLASIPPAARREYPPDRRVREEIEETFNHPRVIIGKARASKRGDSKGMSRFFMGEAKRLSAFINTMPDAIACSRGLLQRFLALLIEDSYLAGIWGAASQAPLAARASDRRTARSERP